MCIGLLYAMKGEIESLLTEETPLLQEKAGVLFTAFRRTSSPAAAVWARSTPPWPPSCLSTCTTPTSF